MSGVLAGASYPVRAMMLLTRTPRLWRYVVIPILVNLAVGVIVYVGLLFAGLRAIDALAAGLPAWATALGFVLRLLLIVALLLVTGFVLARFGIVLGAPWYAQLSERLERMCLGAAPPAGAGGLGAALGDFGRAVRYEVQKLLLVLGVGALLLSFNLLPVIGTLAAAAGGVALGATIACLDFLDPPLERRRLAFGEKLHVVRRSLPASAGFGLVCLGLVSIPFINLFTIPVCVAAGTLFFCDRVPLGATATFDTAQPQQEHT